MTDIIKETIGTRLTLKAWRRAKGYTQAELANLVGVSEATIKGWEAHRTYPTPPRIDALCMAFGCHYDDIIF